MVCLTGCMVGEFGAASMVPRKAEGRMLAPSEACLTQTHAAEPVGGALPMYSTNPTRPATSAWQPIGKLLENGVGPVDLANLAGQSY